MSRRLAALLVPVLLLTACGDDGGDDDTTTTSESSTTSVPDDGALPGERVELYPYEGAELAVVGVEADDDLKLRSGPGVDFDVVLELEPLATGLIATGHNRSLGDGGFWSQIRVQGQVGWASSSFLLQPGQTNDLTAELFAETADRPGAETMLELGQAVAALRASEEPRSRVVVVDGPRVGDLGEITVDVIGLGDDALGGERLAVFGEPDPSGEGFVLRTVEGTLLCSRGVSGEGLCV